jgi:hypothetical protein
LPAYEGVIMRFLAVLFGIILLLPGLCSAGFMLQLIPQAVLAIAVRGIGGIGTIFGVVFGPMGLLWLSASRSASAASS